MKAAAATIAPEGVSDSPPPPPPPPPIKRHHSRFNEESPSLIQTSVKHYVRGTLWIVPVALGCYLLGWGNFAARDVVLKATIGDTTQIQDQHEGVDVLIGTVGGRLCYEAMVALLKTPKAGFLYIKRKPLMILIEGALWAAFGVLGFRRYGLHPLWVGFTGFWFSNAACTLRYSDMRWQDAIKKGSLSAISAWTYLLVISAYIAVATSEQLGPVAEVLITGIAYPALAWGLRLLTLLAVAKSDARSLGQDEHAFFEDFTRVTEMALSIPCVVSILRLDTTIAFVAAAALAFVCECGGIYVTVLCYTPQVYKAGSRSLAASLNRLRKHGRSDVGDSGATSIERDSSNVLIGVLEQKKRRLALRLANEEWAERLGVVTAAPLVLIFAPGITAQTLALRTLGLFVAEAGVDAVNTAICHRFGVLVGRVEVRLDAWSAAMCVAQYLTISWVLSVGVVLHKYI